MAILTVGIPCYNEAATIGKVISDFRRVFPDAKILVIDNNSTDATGDIAKHYGADVLVEGRQGKGYAVQSLFREANSEWLLMVDGDDTYPAEEAEKMFCMARSERCDTVVGWRTCDSGGAFIPTHTWANRLLSFGIEKIMGAPCGDLFSGLRLFHRRFYKNIPLLATGFEVETELALQTIDKGFSQKNIRIMYRSRPEGSVSKLHTFSDGSRVLVLMARIIKDFKPLAFFGFLGLMLMAFSLLAGAFPVWEYFHYRYVFRVPLAILATGFAMLSSICLACGILLDTTVRHRKEEFLLRMRNMP